MYCVELANAPLFISSDPANYRSPRNANGNCVRDALAGIVVCVGYSSRFDWRVLVSVLDTVRLEKKHNRGHGMPPIDRHTRKN